MTIKPAATVIQRSTATETEWLAARRTGVGGSDIAAILGDSPWGSAYSVWMTKVAATDSSFDKAAFRRGHDMEPLLKRLVPDRIGTTVKAAGLRRSKANDRMLASVDGDTGDGGHVEFKTVGTWARKSWDGGIPAQYLHQAHYYMAVSGRPHVWLCAWDMDAWDWLHVEKVEADPAELFERYSPVVDWFWRYVESDTPPPLDPLTATDEELLARWPHVIEPDSIADPDFYEPFIDLYTERAALKDQAKQTDARLKQIDGLIKSAIGDREYLAADGRPLFRWREIKQSRFDQKRFAADHPDLAEQYRTAPTYRRLDPVKGALDTESEAA